jgi:hypothetical protein
MFVQLLAKVCFCPCLINMQSLLSLGIVLSHFDCTQSLLLLPKN